MVFSDTGLIATSREQYTMPSQEIRRNLKTAAFALDDAAQDLFREAKGYTEPEFLMAMAKIAQHQDDEDLLIIPSDEVKGHRTVAIIK